jgi:hypothetical protein
VPILAVVLGLSQGICRADLIDFEAQGASAPSVFTGALNSPLVIGDATFTGGQLLFDENFSLDETAIYATTNFYGNTYSYANPIVITFATPVDGFSILVISGVDNSYTVADNLGGSTSSFLGELGSQTFSLPDAGIGSVTITSADDSEDYPGITDFSIDNVSFTPVPEPSSMAVAWLGGGVLYTRSRRRAPLLSNRSA